MPLTAQQQTVANHDRDHALCIAVAGSGKTTTLAHLINNLLNKGHPSRRMMVMMFNKAAQQDFQKKLKVICTPSSVSFDANNDTGHQPLPEVRTYHATGLRLLRTLEGWQVREPYNKQPLSEKVIELQVRALIQALAPASIQERMRSDAARYIEAANGFIDNVKANLASPEDWFETAGYASEHRFLIKLFHQFEQWRHHQKSITFTDMLYDPVSLLTVNPELVSRIENKMDFIIVDEYQDTSTLQHRFTRLIAGDRANVIAVGDPDQTIYEFAGANINNILRHFQQDYSSGVNSSGIKSSEVKDSEVKGAGMEGAGRKTVHELTLPHTFRYGHSIALAASHLISQNRARKKVFCIAHEDNRPSIIRLSQESDDSKAVVRELQNCLSSGTPPGDIAILVRVWAQSVNIELSLLENGINYSCGGPSLFLRPELETLVFALQMTAGWFSHCEPDVRGRKLTRMLTLPHIGLKQHALQGLIRALQPLDQGYGKAMENQVSKLKGITDFQRRRLQDRARVLRDLEHAGQQESAYKILATYIQQSELYDNLRSMSLNEQRTEEQILAIKSEATPDKMVAFHNMVHKIAGSAGSYGFQTTSALCRAMEARTHDMIFTGTADMNAFEVFFRD
ncbi:MAG: UvrD-helicase domain-containing protein, partial [Endozoicomonas sp.]